MIKLKISLPTGIYFEHNVERIYAPSPLGDVCVNFGHADMMSVLNPGLLRVEINHNIERFVINGGVLNVTSEEIVIITKNCLSEEEASKLDFPALIANYKDSPIGNFYKICSKYFL